MEDNISTIAEQIEEYASLFFTIDEIALMVNYPADELRRDILSENVYGMAYKRGTLLSQRAIRQGQLNLAISGDIDSAEYLAKLIMEQKRIENE